MKKEKKTIRELRLERALKSLAAQILLGADHKKMLNTISRALRPQKPTPISPVERAKLKMVYERHHPRASAQ